jgi:hypothetical protein
MEDRMTNHYRALLALAIIGATGLVTRTATVGAQDDGDAQRSGADGAAQRCLSLNRIDHTEIVDDDTILFHLRGREIYENSLPRRCPQLSSEERFMYRVSGSQLCDLDTITVLDDIGFGFMPGATCGLGQFVPISAEAADELVQAAKARDRRTD